MITVFALITAFTALPAHARRLRRRYVDHTPAVAKYLEQSGISVDQAELKACAADGDRQRSSLRDRPKYLAVMLKTFARSVCRSNNDITKVAMLDGNPDNDAVDRRVRMAATGRSTRFASLSAGAGVPLTSRESTTLINTYALLFGLGLRESDGNFHEGPDRSARHFTSASIEAGAFQTSYDVHSCLDRDARKGLKNLEQSYANASKDDCMNLDGGNRPVPDASRSSSAFQIALKSCPALAVEHAAITIRQCKTHYGPLIRHEAKVMRQCVPLMQSIAAQAVSDPDLCNNIRLGGPESAPASAPAPRLIEASAATTIMR